MFAVIYIPDFWLQAALRHAPELREQPVALLGESVPNAPIVQMTAAAQGAGVVLGMTPTQALARCRGIRIQSRSHPAEGAARQALLQCAFGFAPFVEETAEGVCTLDLRGQTIGESWAERVRDGISLLNLHAQIGLAATPDLALLAARVAAPVLRVEQGADFTASLPVESLEPSAPVRDILRGWGIRTIGQLVGLGKQPVAQRLGAEGLLLFERAAAHEMRPLRMAVPAEEFAEAADLQEEIEKLEPLLFLLRRFLEQLSRRLALVYLVAQELKLTLRLASGKSYERNFRVPSPTREVETLFRMLFAHLENVTTDAPIVGLRLEAIASHSETHQFALFETSLRDPNHFFETIARLSAMLGQERVGSPVLENSHRADHFKMEPVRFLELENDSGIERKTAAPAHDDCAFQYGLVLRRFRPPVPAEVRLEEARPAHVESGKVRGRIARASGPWRTSGDWWERPWARDEWDIQTATGRLCRIFQEREQWFVDGVFD